MEATSWNQQAALASLVAVIVGFVAGLLIVDFSALNPAAGPTVALTIVLGGFFLPFLYWRSTMGYVGAVIVGFLALMNQGFAIADVAAGNLPGEIYINIVPELIFALLLIGTSVLAWRES